MTYPNAHAAPNLDAYAKAAGYPDYATMQAFQARQSAGYHGNNSAAMQPVVPTAQNQHPGTPAAPAAPQGVWDRILSLWPTK